MGYSHVNSKGRRYFFHMQKNARGGRLQWFSFTEEGSVDLPDGYTVKEGPTGLPIAKKTNIEGI